MRGIYLCEDARAETGCVRVCVTACVRAPGVFADLLANARQVGWVDELKLREEVRLLRRV